MNVSIALAVLLARPEPVRLREIPYNYTSFSDREIVIRLLGASTPGPCSTSCAARAPHRAGRRGCLYEVLERHLGRQRNPHPGRPDRSTPPTAQDASGRYAAPASRDRQAPHAAGKPGARPPRRPAVDAANAPSPEFDATLVEVGGPAQSVAKTPGALHGQKTTSSLTACASAT